MEIKRLKRLNRKKLFKVFSDLSYNVYSIGSELKMFDSRMKQVKEGGIEITKSGFEITPEIREKWAIGNFKEAQNIAKLNHKMLQNLYKMIDPELAEKRFWETVHECAELHNKK